MLEGSRRAGAGGHKILVTGAAGFLGSHVTKELLDLEQRVVGLDDLSGGTLTRLDRRAEFVRGSILDVPLIERLFAEHRFDYVFHFAAYAAEGLSHFIKRFNYQNNLVGSVNLINAAVNFDVKCFVFASSAAVYGHAPLRATEECPVSPVDPYGIAKAAVEQELRISARLFGLPYIVFRPHNVYGPGQNLADPYRNVVGIFMNQLLRGEAMTIFGSGAQTRAFSYVGDVAPCLARSVFVPAAYHQTFNLGADETSTIARLAERIAQALGRPPQCLYLEGREEVEHLSLNHDKAKALLRFESRISLEEGVNEMARWAREVGPQACSRFGEFEIQRGLPTTWRASSEQPGTPPAATPSRP